MRIPFITPLSALTEFQGFSSTTLFSACSWMRAPQTPTASPLCSPSFVLPFMVKIDLCPVGVVKLPATALSSSACLVCGILTGAPYRRVYPFSLLRRGKFFSDSRGLLSFGQYWSIHFCSSLLILPSQAIKLVRTGTQRFMFETTSLGPGIASGKRCSVYQSCRTLL